MSDLPRFAAQRETIDDDLNLAVSRSRPIRDQVADNLRSAIVNMKFHPGQRLVERELCELTGASRASLRQALRVLESEGLVETQNGRGITVAVPTATQISELYLLRAHLEGLAVRLATQVADDETRARLRACLATMAPKRGDDNMTILRAKDEFYAIVFATINNETLEHHIAMIHRRIPQMRATSITQPGRGEAAYEEMREVIDAMVAGAAERAERAMVAHVTNAGDTAQRAVP